MTSGIIRVHNPKKYVVIGHEMLRDVRLSFAARGLLAYLLSKPHNWKMQTSDLIKQSPAGRDAIYTILKELKTYGYMRRIRTKEAHGHFGWETEVREVPLSQEDIAFDEVAPPLTAFPDMDEPYTENPDTDEPDTDEPDTEKPEHKNYREEEVMNKEVLSKELLNTHTHKEEPAPRAANSRSPAPAPDEKVCVCAGPHKSKFCYPERKQHAALNALGAGWLSKSADGTYDDLIADGLAGSTSPTSSATDHTAAPPAREPAFNELAQYVRSRMSLGESPQTIIDGLEMCEATRHKLISQFVAADGNATPEADGTSSSIVTKPEKGN